MFFLAENRLHYLKHRKGKFYNTIQFPVGSICRDYSFLEITW